MGQMCVIVHVWEWGLVGSMLNCVCVCVCVCAHAQAPAVCCCFQCRAVDIYVLVKSHLKS